MKMNDFVAYERAKNQNAIHTCFTFYSKGFCSYVPTT